MIESAKLEVLLIDPCFSEHGLSNQVMPLSLGFVGSNLKHEIPDVNITILKSSTEIISFIDNKKPDFLGICNYMWNTNLANRLARYAREKNPKTFVVYGGPEINKKPAYNQKNFIKKYAHADMLIEHEGEVAFTQLVKTYLEEDGDTKKIRSRIKELGNCFYISQEKKIISGPEIVRNKHLNEIPSPYLTGLFDNFLKQGIYQPLIQTNRGCPYKCTFCQEGLEYYNKLRFREVDFVKEELDYIAERINPDVGLWIADSNWGMYKQDVEISHHIKKLKDKYNWPHYINCSTGKSQLERIQHVAEILDGSLKIMNSMQSLDENVLTAIKRKNALNVKEFMVENEYVSEPDLVMPLPEETYKSFIKGFNDLLDTKARLRICVYPTLLLSNTEMNEPQAQEKYGLQIKYRQHRNQTGWVAGELVCETECNIFSTSSMSVKEVIRARQYVVLADALMRWEPLKEIFYYLDSKKIERSDLTMSLFNSFDTASKGIQKCFSDYSDGIISESFDTEEEVFEYMKKFSEDYTLGKRGGDLLRYSNQLWIDHFDEMIEWVFLHLKKITPNNKETENEITALTKYFTYLYYERSNICLKKAPSVKQRFNYDILRWMEKPSKQLSEFKKEVQYNFEETKFSTFSNRDMHKSFGFNLSKKELNNYNNLKRIYLSVTRRKISRKDGFDVKQKTSKAADFFEKVSL